VARAILITFKYHSLKEMQAFSKERITSFVIGATFGEISGHKVVVMLNWDMLAKCLKLYYFLEL
jgi:hypothetical protein